MAPRLPKVSRFSGHWRRPITSIYNDNYLFGFNFYDDMMTWLDKRDIGVDPGPVVSLPSVPETQFKKFAREKDDRLFRKDCDAAVRRTQARIDKMAPRPHGLRSEREDLNREAVLSKTSSYSAFTSSAIADIDTQMSLQRSRPTSANAFFRKPLRTERDYDVFLKNIDKRRQRRLLEKDFENEYLESPRRSAMRNFDHDIARRREEILLDEKLRRGGSPPRDILGADKFRRSASPMREIYTSERFRHSMRDSGFSSAPGSRAGSPVRGMNAIDELMNNPSSWEMKCKQMQMEIEQLNHRLVDAESKLKTEVPRVKSNYQRQIEELEMRLDSANRNNMDLQKKIKSQYTD
uniref:Uncharacterized protein n=1 Tax=Strigamia maritima TaxID=126957 RepID=T1J8P3_STRMM